MTYRPILSLIVGISCLGVALSGCGQKSDDAKTEKSGEPNSGATSKHDETGEKSGDVGGGQVGGYPQDVERISLRDAKAPVEKILTFEADREIALEGGFLDILFSSDGTQVYVLNETNGISVLDPKSFELVTTWEGSAPLLEDDEVDELTMFALSQDGSTLAVGHDSGNVSVWNTREGSLQYVDKRHAQSDGDLDGIAVSPDGGLIVSGDDSFGCERNYFAWDSKTGDTKWTSVCFWTNKPATFTPDGKVVAVKGEDGSDVHFLDPITGEMLWELKFGGDSSDAFHAVDSDTIYAINFEGNSVPDSMKIASISAKTGKANWLAKGPDAYSCGDATVAPNGSILAALTTHDNAEGETQKITLWNAESGKYLGTLEDERFTAAPLRFTPDSKYLVIPSEDGALMWDHAKHLAE